LSKKFELRYPLRSNEQKAACTGDDNKKEVRGELYKGRINLFVSWGNRRVVALLEIIKILLSP